MAEVLCIGELLIDFVCTDRDSSLIDGENFIKKAGGAPANVAVAIKNMGVNVNLLASVGDDYFGDFLKQTISSYDIDDSNIIKLPNQHTTMAFVSLKKDGERDFTFVRGADKNFSLQNVDSKILANSKVYHFGSATAFLGGELEESYNSLFEYAKKENKIIVFDPNYRSGLHANCKEDFINKSKKFISNSTVVKVSEDEAMLITGKIDINEAGKELINFGAKFVLMTLGKDGTLIFSDDKTEHMKVEPVKMVDATGAGDAFIGAVISCIAKECYDANDLDFDKIKSYVNFGNKVGGITVKSYGAMNSIPKYDDVVKLI